MRTHTFGLPGLWHAGGSDTPWSLQTQFLPQDMGCGLWARLTSQPGAKDLQDSTAGDNIRHAIHPLGLMVKYQNTLFIFGFDLAERD